MSSTNNTLDILVLIDTTKKKLPKIRSEAYVNMVKK